MFGGVSVTKKMLVMTVLLGGVVWFAMELIQERHLRQSLLDEQIIDDAHHAREDSVLFDKQVQGVHLSSEVIIHQKRFLDYIRDPAWRVGGAPREHFSPPHWMPEPSILRNLFDSRYVLLLTPAGEVKEIYYNNGEYDKGTLPAALLNPDPLLLKLSHDQSYMSAIAGGFYVIANKDVITEQGSHIATLMLVSPIDDEFMDHAKGISDNTDSIIALIDSETKRVVASSDPDLIGAGDPITALNPDYMMIGKSFLDYGGSDLTLQFASFIPAININIRVDSFLDESSRQRLYLAAVLIVAFGALTYWMTRKIKILNEEVMTFTESISGVKVGKRISCDELVELEHRFHSLAEAVKSAHARIKQEAEEKIVLSEKVSEAMRKARELELMKSVTDTLSVGIAVKNKDGIVPFNSRMKQFVEQCEGLEQLIDGESDETERSVVDREGMRRAFAIIRHDVLGNYGFLVQEITVHKEAEAAMAKAKEYAEAANQAKSAFLANMSHELRTPMHAILSYASLGARKAEKAPAEKLKEYFSNINASGDRLLMLLDDLLDLSKLEVLKMEFVVGKYDLVAIARIVADEFSGLLKERSLELVINRECADAKIVCDENRMLQVVRNLISNAIKFTPSGRSITIGVSDYALQGDDAATPAVMLSVADEGVGIPEDELERVFDKFVQSSKTKTNAGGTGLGLAICKEIVEQQQGRIWAENNAQGGATFVVVMPR